MPEAMCPQVAVLVWNNMVPVLDLWYLLDPLQATAARAQSRLQPLPISKLLVPPGVVHLFSKAISRDIK